VTRQAPVVEFFFLTREIHSKDFAFNCSSFCFQVAGIHFRVALTMTFHEMRAAAAFLLAITGLALLIITHRPSSITVVSLEQEGEGQGSHVAVVGGSKARGRAWAGNRGGIDDVEKYRSAAILDAEQVRESAEAKRELEASGGSLEGESAMLARFAKDQKEGLAKAASAVQRAKKRAEQYGWVDTDIDEGLHMLAGSRGGVKRRNIFPSFARRVGHSLDRLHHQHPPKHIVKP
jgi:hypothetical protein